tara:strand:- start:2470 stop:2760 length:291 start_codon:yes stop_codon:yes gene_type:complete
MGIINDCFCVLLAGSLYFLTRTIKKKDEKIRTLNELTLNIVTTIEEGFGILTDKVADVNDHVNNTDLKIKETLEIIKKRLISIEYRIDKLEMVGIL